MTDRKMYKLTKKDIKRAEGARMYAENALARIEENAAKLKKQRKYGLKKRDVALKALKGDPEYIRGLWQGRIDAANGLEYSEERLESAYNSGYYTGYTNYKRDLRGGLVIPEEYLIG